MEINIDKIIETSSIEILMQPILAPSKEFAVGIEALARGIDFETGDIISPSKLFEEADKQNKTVEFEIFLIKKAIEEYNKFFVKNADSLLFINIGMKSLDYCVYNKVIDMELAKYNIPYANIVFDLKNIDLLDTYSLKRFSEYYKEKGCSISIDDIGSDYSNLDKMILVNPDIIKINSSLINKLENEIYKEYLMHFIHAISNKLGIVIVAKGIETRVDLIDSIKSGANFIQGYYIAKPVKIEELDIQKNIMEMSQLVDFENEFDDGYLEQNRIIMGKLLRFSKELQLEIDISKLENIEYINNKIFSKYMYIENIWVLDEKGIQISESIANSLNYQLRNASIFQIYKKGSDFSKKELFQQLKDTFLDAWLTKPFISMLTNNVCVSVSVLSKIDGSVLCININYEDFLKTINKEKNNNSK